MRRHFQGLYVRLLRANVAVRQRLFQIWLGRRKAELAEADLSYLNLSGTDLSGADLRGAILVRSDLTGVNLAGADLSDADLRGARVTAEQLAQAKSVAGAILPDGSIGLP